MDALKARLSIPLECISSCNQRLSYWYPKLKSYSNLCIMQYTFLLCVNRNIILRVSIPKSFAVNLRNILAVYSIVQKSSRCGAMEMMRLTSSRAHSYSLPWTLELNHLSARFHLFMTLANVNFGILRRHPDISMRVCSNCNGLQPAARSVSCGN